MVADAILRYKKALLIYLSLAGDTPELTKYHLKLLDIIDDQATGMTDRAGAELLRMAISIVSMLSYHICDLLDKIGQDKSLDNLLKVAAVLRDQLKQVGKLGNCCDTFDALVRVSANALDRLKEATGIDYPNIEAI